MRPARVDGWIARLFPPACVLCGAPEQGHDLCGPCSDDLPWIRHGCSRCGRPVPLQAPTGPCGACRWPSAAFSRVVAALVYEYPLDRLVSLCKYQQRIDLGRLLGELLAARIALLAAAPAWTMPDLLLPVPLHPRREAARGFNQAAEIASVAGRRLGLRADARLASRVRETGAQAGLPAAQRARNLRGAFLASPDCAGLRVAVIDDVITTGATAMALASAARAAGALEVECWAVALTW
ncbi:MAG: ComF family protein [Chromatiales bacterium]|nr:ComF family protein [Chromatiales bacterium]